MSQLPAAQQPRQIQQYGSIDTEQRLLDALEAATFELRAQTLHIKETVLGHNQQITTLDHDMVDASDAIRDQRTRLTAYRDFRSQTEHLYYSIIFVEVVILFFMIFTGLD